MGKHPKRDPKISRSAKSDFLGIETLKKGVQNLENHRVDPLIPGFQDRFLAVFIPDYLILPDPSFLGFDTDFEIALVSDFGTPQNR